MWSNTFTDETEGVHCQQKLLYKNFLRKFFRQKNYEAENMDLHKKIKNTENRINEGKIKFIFSHF